MPVRGQGPNRRHYLLDSDSHRRQRYKTTARLILILPDLRPPMDRKSPCDDFTPVFTSHHMIGMVIGRAILWR
jgi:hypothetical protein